MNVALRQPRMTREEFLDWPGHVDGRYEFDGVQPVAMTGGSLGASRIAANLLEALKTRLGNGPCQALGPDAAVATIGNAVRYPDALVTCSKFKDSDYLTPGAVIVFEVVNKGSGHTDRVAKVREYRAVPSIRRYVIVEHRAIRATVRARPDGSAEWTQSPVASGGLPHLPEVGIEFPIDLLYEGTDLNSA